MSSTRSPAPPAPATDQAALAGLMRAVARGPNLGRTLTQAEAREAMRLLLGEAAAPEQVGALLAVLRFRGETSEELAGFIAAARAAAPRPAAPLALLDWPSYADRHKQLPYFVLAARLLTDAGVSVLMHGIAGAGAGTTPAVLAALGVAPARSLADAAARIGADGFAYLPVSVACPKLHRLLGLREVLGVRTVANSVARALNPGDAKLQLIGTFHPDFQRRQAAAAALAGDVRAMVLRGAGGEVQRNPEKPCTVLDVADGVVAEAEWPALTAGLRHPWRDEPLDPVRVLALWRGDVAPAGPVAAVKGTAAIALRLAGRAATAAAAEAMAERLWQCRRRDR